MKRTGSARAIRSTALVILASWVTGFAPWSRAQTPPLGVPSITAATKGPDQINLAWPAVSNPGYGYLVEIQSDADSRFSSWQELKPVPRASGYTCDSTVTIRGATCSISDPAGAHVYNPASNGVPPWVTEPQYVDPVDGSPVQFIAASLKPNTAYSFRVRSYSAAGTGPYSNVSAATTANYTKRFVSPTGKDSNDGTAADDAHAWLTLAHGSSALACGQVLMIRGGSYRSDRISMSQACSAASRAVVLVNPGETAAIVSGQPGADSAVVLNGSYLVVDGLVSAAVSPSNDYQFVVTGAHNALFHIEAHPAIIPNATGGVALRGVYSLLYGSYLHDSGSPDATQNPSGNGGFVLVVEGASNNVIWSNHLTRGGHDVSLCVRRCIHNRWLNNIMDGGWGMGFEAIQQSQYNLVEGSFVKDVGQSVAFYKPSFELSSGFNTLRRNTSVNGKSWAVEVSALYGGDTAAGNLVYNNVFYAPGGCLFQSHNDGGLGVAAYDNNVWANNICYKFSGGSATDIYLGNTKSQFVSNTFLSVGATGPLRDRRVLIWSHDTPGGFEYPVTVAEADLKYSPPFSGNAALTVAPRFVDEVNSDFHLLPGSPLIGAGTRITDTVWGTALGTADLGAFGILRVSPVPPGGPPARVP